MLRSPVTSISLVEDPSILKLAGAMRILRGRERAGVSGFLESKELTKGSFGSPFIERKEIRYPINW